ncbi:hypothetical protein SAMN05443551_2013 [Marivita hallyeonensis]|uniref:Uncharacterized protein n=1 Tax=Marivita hallyeonensis TaxID=996342 RepID=A0A1M5S746_9RHOB|nr:hypothetical protein SAMN05443551_2013 [Marivita hallyeonensis]
MTLIYSPKIHNAMKCMIVILCLTLAQAGTAALIFAR